MTHIISENAVPGESDVVFSADFNRTFPVSLPAVSLFVLDLTASVPAIHRPKALSASLPEALPDALSDALSVQLLPWPNARMRQNQSQSRMAELGHHPLWQDLGPPRLHLVGF
ncbi:hypothetical protein VB005_01639 [Metarhizium brunneum]